MHWILKILVKEDSDFTQYSKLLPSYLRHWTNTFRTIWSCSWRMTSRTLKRLIWRSTSKLTTLNLQLLQNYCSYHHICLKKSQLLSKTMHSTVWLKIKCSAPKLKSLKSMTSLIWSPIRSLTFSTQCHKGSYSRQLLKSEWNSHRTCHTNRYRRVFCAMMSARLVDLLKGRHLLISIRTWSKPSSWLL